MTTSAEMIDYLAGNVSCIIPIWKITSRDGLVGAYMAHTRNTVGRLINGSSPFVFGGVTYKVAPVQATRDMHKIGLSPNSTQINGVFDDIITRADVEGGRWKMARIVYEYVSYLDLSMGSTGRISGVAGKWSPYGISYSVEVMSVASLLTQQIGEMTSPLDRNSFPSGLTITGANEVQRLVSTATGGTFALTFTNPAGSSATTSPIAWNASAATIQTALLALSSMPATSVVCSGGPLNTTPVLITFGNSLALTPVFTIFVDDSLATSGTVRMFTDVEGSPNYTITRNVSSSSDRRHVLVDGATLANGYYDYGVLKCTSGANSISPGMEIKNNVGNLITLQLPLQSDFLPGDAVTLLAGYDGTRAQARDKFHDAVNFDGEPDLPGLKVLFTYPE